MIALFGSEGGGCDGLGLPLALNPFRALSRQPAASAVYRRFSTSPPWIPFSPSPTAPHPFRSASSPFFTFALSCSSGNAFHSFKASTTLLLPTILLHPLIRQPFPDPARHRPRPRNLDLGTQRFFGCIAQLLSNYYTAPRQLFSYRKTATVTHLPSRSLVCSVLND